MQQRAIVPKLADGVERQLKAEELAAEEKRGEEMEEKSVAVKKERRAEPEEGEDRPPRS